jgi:hypothetical protein
MLYQFGIVAEIANVAKNVPDADQKKYKDAIVAVLEQDVKSMTKLGWALMPADVGAMILEYAQECK